MDPHAGLRLAEENRYLYKMKDFLLLTTGACLELHFSFKTQLEKQENWTFPRFQETVIHLYQVSAGSPPGSTPEVHDYYNQSLWKWLLSVYKWGNWAQELAEFKYKEQNANDTTPNSFSPKQSQVLYIAPERLELPLQLITNSLIS